MITDVVMPGMNGRALAERLRVARPETKYSTYQGTRRRCLREATFQRAQTFS